MWLWPITFDFQFFVFLPIILSCPTLKQLNKLMKPPEGILKSFCPNDVIFYVTWRQDVVLCCHMMPWYETIGHGFVSCHSNQKKASKIAWKSHFLTWQPWPLIYDLDHRTWPICGPGWHIYQISCLCVKWFCRESADTDRTDSITSTADAGG